MAKGNKPNFEHCTVPVRKGDFAAWLDLVFSTAVDAGERQMKLNAAQKTAGKRVNAAHSMIQKAAAEAARRRRGGGAGEAA
ncbi:MAG: hypothetical protein EOM26_13180 [Alphaproteobacteria bacterium]|jgi:hypothetical protein|nr:hypothetical protein [Alphaproteobacteria bacterium]